MATALIVEVLDHRGGVHHRVRLDALPATVGRAYSNDVILDDPYVCPCHLRLTRDDQGQLVAEDLASVNGLRERGHGERVERLPVRGGSEIRIGHTVLRLCHPDQPVAATAAEAAVGIRLRHYLASPVALAGVCAAALAALVLESYFGDPDRVTAAGLLGGALAVYVALAFWSGCWAIASRIVSHSFRFFSHLALACGALLAITAATTGAEWLDFFFPGADAGTALSAASGLAVITALFYGHLATVSDLPPRRLWRVSLAISGGLVAIALLAANADQEIFSGGMEYSAVLKPVGSRWVRTVSLDEFVQRTGEVKDAVDELAKED